MTDAPLPLAWWPSYYIGRLHAVRLRPGETRAFAVCGAPAWNPAALSEHWQAKRLAKGVPRCGSCERRLGAAREPVQAP